MEQLSLFEQPVETTPPIESDYDLFDDTMAKLEKLNKLADEQNKLLEEMILELNPDCSTMEEVHAKLNPPVEKVASKPKEIMTKKISDKAIETLRGCIVDGNVVKLPGEALDRKIYLEVKQSLELIGGKWKSGKTQGFVFDRDPSELISQITDGQGATAKKDFQFFATPPELCDDLVKRANINSQSIVLEPSAGRGAIIDSIHRHIPGLFLDYCELMEINQVFLNDKACINKVCDDFLKITGTQKYTHVIANPPFSKNQDIDHIKKMWEVLKPGGRIATIASTSWRTGSQRKQVAFREWLEEVGAVVEDVEAGAFKESGTNIPTVIITIDKP